MKRFLLFIPVFYFPYLLLGQSITTINSIRGSYTICRNKIYEGTKIDSSKFVATIRGNQILKLESVDSKDVWYTVVNEKIFKTSDTVQKNLLFYLEKDKIYLKTKKETFEYAGSYIREANGAASMLGFLEPFEFIALLIAVEDLDN